MKEITVGDRKYTIISKDEKEIARRTAGLEALSLAIKTEQEKIELEKKLCKTCGQEIKDGDNNIR